MDRRYTPCLLALLAALAIAPSTVAPAPAPPAPPAVTAPPVPSAVPPAAATPPPGPSTAPPVAAASPPSAGKADLSGLPPVPSDPAAPLPLDPAIATGKLANGLTWYFRENARPEKRAQLWLVVNAGSVLEDDDQRGLAHLVEHMCFDGTARFPKRNITHYLESIGMRLGPDLNASTGFDATVYTLQVPTDKPEFVDQGLAILAEWAHAVTFDPAEFERERGVVIEEWRLGRGAQARMLDKQLPIVLKGSRYADRLPIGTLESLRQAKREALRRFYHDWYRPDLMAVVAVGDFRAYGPERLGKRLRQTFAGLVNPAPERPRPVVPVPAHDDTRFAIATDSEATRSTVLIEVSQPKRPERSAADFRRLLVEGLYHGMLNARLAELASRPDPPFANARSGAGTTVRALDVEDDVAVVVNGGLLPGLRALLTEVERVRRHGFAAAELERQKVSVLRALEQSYVERGSVASGDRANAIRRLFLEQLALPGQAVELALARQLLPGIELDEVNRLAAGWSAEADRVIAINAPAKPDVPVPDEAQLREAFAAVRASDPAPWVDRTQEGPLVPVPPKPAAIVGERRIPELEVTEWQLANGVRVVLKPTDFKSDEILLSGFDPGGLSLVPDAELTSGELATLVVRESGLGSFDPVTLRKALAGNTANASTRIGDFEETVAGTAATRDLETMFQLVYLGFTAPRHDLDAIRSILARLKGALENRSAQPQVVFSDKLTEALHPGDPRERPISVERLSEFDYDTAFRLYRERFADATGFTFFLVGSFTLDQIRPLVTTWLGGLPAAGRHETWRPVGGRPPAGIVHVAVTMGKEPKSQVRIVFTGDAHFSRQDLHEMTTLVRLLQLRLREVLRDDLGAVYGVNVAGGLTLRPYQRFNVNIGFACAPDKVEELTHAIFQEIAAIQAHGIDQDHLDKVKAGMRRERETNLKENSFWLAVLANYDRSGWDPRGILQFDRLIDRTTADRIQAAARQYLPADRYVIGVLSPEAAAKP